ncbi:fibronectin type III domain-containing protein [Curtobacterium oceanosedimentum]|uniref:fibronectin type III domain-containing protein n=1 Tax=Curtobacterium oceanosedimentum TaxID=465820 RepID=UPI001CE215D0|nr:fibronectin type III domain-containing protein [Curtobacterium oceanosedimentum]MCA5923794.1 fibronectin type III domain-containing protein [Curtobacterium oceanosedimentum]
MLSRSARPRRRARLSAAALAAALVGSLTLIAAPAAQAAPATGTIDRATEKQWSGLSFPAGSGQVYVPSRSGQLTGADINWWPYGATNVTGLVSVYAGSSATGTALATGTISQAGGWQTVSFATPPTVTAGSTYFFALPKGSVYTSNAPAPGEGLIAGGRSSVGFESFNYRTYVLTIPAPGTFTATAGDGTAALSWTAPTPPADTTVTGYETEYAEHGSGSWSAPAATTATTATVTGLTDGTAYDFRVRATTDRGPGLWSATATATPMGDFAGGSLTIDDAKLAVGKSVTASSDGWTPAPSLTWSWTVDGAPVSTAATYTPTPDALGKAVQVTVTANAVGRHTATKTADLGTVGSGTIAPGTVRIADARDATVGSSAKAGTVLTASLPAVVPTDAAVRYQWYRDSTNVQIPGATTEQYTVTGRDAIGGHEVFVIASVTSRGYTATTATSDTVAATSGTQTGTVATGAATVAEPITATTSGWTPAGAEVALQWFDGDRALAGATSASYTPTAAQAGHSLHVVATGTAEGYDRYSVASTPALVGEGRQHGTVGIDGDPAVGTALTVTDTGWLEGTSFDRRWTRDGVAIVGATGVTYTPTADDVDAVLGVTVAGHLDGYTDRTVDAATDVAVIAGTQHASAMIEATGTAQVGAELTARSTGWVEGTELSYRWLSDGTAVDGATSRTYTPVEADLGHVVSVEVTGTLSGWEPLTVTSDGTVPVAGIPATTTPESTLPTTVVAGEPFRYHVDVAGSPAPTVTFDGDLPAGLTFDAATGDITGVATKAGHWVVRITATNGVGFPAVSTVTIDVAPGELDALTLTTRGTGNEDGTVTAEQGSTIRVDAIGADAFGNELVTPGDVTLTSSVASDEIDGATVTFHHASPHVITATVGAVSASMLVEVSPTAVVTPPTTTDPTNPTEPTVPAAEPTTGAVVAPVDDRSGQATTTPDADELAYTGAEGAGPAAVAALLAVVLGLCLRSGVRRSRQRS